jgi:L-Ala-D/L-Glu epimerase
MRLTFRRVDWEYNSVFRIAYRTAAHVETVVVELLERGRVGRGEAMGVSYHGETAEAMLDQLATVAGDVSNGISRAELQKRLPPGGARNAIDCALWDLEAQCSGCPAWQLAGLTAVRPVTTAYTLGLDSLEATAQAAAATTRYSLLKLKLSGEDDVARVQVVRSVRPDLELIVDANQAWSEQQLRDIVPRLAEPRVALIEQPLSRMDDRILAQFSSPVPLCADQSCQTSASPGAVRGKYEYVNIKLGKTGGLTEALCLARQATQSGLKLMAGCMGGSSLAMAPAFIVAQLCEVVDLDGPLLIKGNTPAAIPYDGSRMPPPPLVCGAGDRR